MSEIKLARRYPNSRLEDITDAFSRGYAAGIDAGAGYTERIAETIAENAKLRELVVRMAEALGIDSEWADPDWCKSPCVLEFGCWPEGDHMSIRCPAWTAMRELGVDE